MNEIMRNFRDSVFHIFSCIMDFYMSNLGLFSLSFFLGIIVVLFSYFFIHDDDSEFFMNFIAFGCALISIGLISFILL